MPVISPTPPLTIIRRDKMSEDAEKFIQAIEQVREDVEGGYEHAHLVWHDDVPPEILKAFRIEQPERSKMIIAGIRVTVKPKAIISYGSRNDTKENQ